MTTAQAVDVVYEYIFGFSFVLLVGILATMVVFVLKYNRKTHPHPEPTPDSNLWLETAWAVVPSLIALSMFWVGWKGYTTLVDVPPGAMVVQVTGRQWSWSFSYANGKTSDKLYVPVNQAVKLELSSPDVVHSFFVPAFDIKKDVVPGMTTYEWFRAPKEGSYDALCTQYCGVGHSGMTTKVVVLSSDKFQQWYQQQSSNGKKPSGQKLLTENGCTGCHSLDGSKSTGPTFKGLFGRQVTVTTSGKQRSLTVDAAYIRRSILNPGADIVKGFQPIMPSFKGKLSDQQIEAIIQFLQGQGSKSAPTSKPQPAENSAAKGKKLVGEKGCLACHSTDGSKKIGPSWKGLYGSKVKVITDGKEHTVTADDKYLVRSIVHPKADVVKGFQPLMSPFKDLTRQQLQDIVAYIKQLQD